MATSHLLYDGNFFQLEQDFSLLNSKLCFPETEGLIGAKNCFSFVDQQIPPVQALPNQQHSCESWQEDQQMHQVVRMQEQLIIALQVLLTLYHTTLPCMLCGKAKKPIWGQDTFAKQLFTTLLGVSLRVMEQHA